MARSCFCGCGRSVGLASRRLNRQGRLLMTMHEGLHRIVLPRVDPEPGLSDGERREVERARANVLSMAEDGAAFREGLMRVLHDEASIRDFDHRRMRAWISTAGQLNTQAIQQ